MAKRGPGGREGARRLALQALYQHEMTGVGLTELRAQFRTRATEVADLDRAYFGDLLGHCIKCRDALDARLASHLDRAMDRLTPIERNILRIACYELSMRSDIPFRVVIDQAVKLARTFGASGGERYVNAVLDSLAVELRSMGPGDS